ncbi:hypothetical protein [Nocardia abscessus]|uniref:hypothetical protein n=1 Tax=Nocardia abscessus TaxID=120957 RepID=UPI002454B67B|nr:hypothetical protein [Nocardia abscessus]
MIPARELCDQDVTVNTVAPGPTATGERPDHPGRRRPGPIEDTSAREHPCRR